MTTRFSKRTSRRKAVIIIAVISLVAGSAFAGPVGAPPSQPAPPTTVSTNALPSKIVTTDGKVYHGVKLIRIEPDGLLVEYEPDAGGIGMGNLKFTKLPASLQKQFGYDPVKASAFEHAQSLATFALSQKMRQDEEARTAMLNDMSQRPNPVGTVSVSSSGPTVTYTYYTPDEKADLVGSSISVCNHDYQCRADFDFHSEQTVAGQPIHFYVDAVRISLGLSCNLILPKTPYDEVRIHAEGHRKIFEYFYQFGPRVADSIGKSMIGEEFTPPETDFEAAKKSALFQAQAVAQSQYITRLDSVAREAEHYFQKLTDYNENNYDSNLAVQQAIAKYSGQIDLQTHASADAPFSHNPVTVPPYIQNPFPPPN